MTAQNIPTFNILSIGPSGVGKSVFLAGTYVELWSGRQAGHDIRFESENEQTQQALRDLLDSMEQTGQYPPPTTEVSSFSFKVTPQRGSEQNHLPVPLGRSSGRHLQPGQP